MSIGILFPGQGSQKIGMGLDLEGTPIGKEIFKKVDDCANRKISDIFLHGTEEELNQTKNTQIAIVSISVVLSLLLEEEIKIKNLKFKPFACCGHSLGEFTALWYSKILSLEELIKLVLIRGDLMQTAPRGAMAAILNLPQEKVEGLLGESDFQNKIVIANYNSPSQFVISGEKDLFDKVLERIKSIGGKAIILRTGGAFHSHLMKEPSKAFSLELDKLAPSNVNSTIPNYQNCDGNSTKDFKTIKEKLKKQMTSPVLWTQTINNLVHDGVRTVVEIGPGKILTGLVKKINPNINCYNVSDISSLKDFVTSYEHELTTTKS